MATEELLTTGPPGAVGRATGPVPFRLPLERTDVPRVGTAAVMVPLAHPFAREIELHEASVFEEAPALFDVDEAGDLFSFLIISVDGMARHVVRLSAPIVTGRPELLPFFITDMVESDPDLTLDEVRSYYRGIDTELEQLISVETQFRLGEQLEPVRSADLAYLSLFRVVGLTRGRGVVAHLNAPAIASFKRVGLDWHPFAGRIDLRTPTVTEDGGVGFDAGYQPVGLPWDSNVELLTALEELIPPIVWL